MTIYELIKVDIQKLSEIRVPMGEPMLYRQISEVLMDLTSLAKAIEACDAQQEAEKKPSAEAEDVPKAEPETPDEAAEGDKPKPKAKRKMPGADK